MLIPAFTFKIGQQIHQGLVVVGKCKNHHILHVFAQNFIISAYLTITFLFLVDGKSPSLACGTTGGKILLHSPHEGNAGGEGGIPPVRLLNFNKKITALAAGIYTALISMSLLMSVLICNTP